MSQTACLIHYYLNSVGWEEGQSTIDVEPSSTPEQKIFQLTGDNLDLAIKTKYMSLDRRSQSLHWFHILATDERVVDPDLSNFRPRCPIQSVPDTASLPSLEDNRYLRKEFAILVERVLVKYLPAFASFEQYVKKHIEHACIL